MASPPTIGGTTFRGPIRSGRYSGDPTTSTLGTAVMVSPDAVLTTTDTNVSAHVVIPNGANVMKIIADITVAFEASAVCTMQFGYGGNVSALGTFGVSAVGHYEYVAAAAKYGAWNAVSAADTTSNNCCPIQMQLISTTTPATGTGTFRILYNLGI